MWIGDGPLASDWDRWVEERNLAEAIRRMPWQADVQPFLLSSDVFLHVAEYEGLPLALLEGMSAALPIVVTENLRAEMPFLNETNSIGVNSSTDCKEILSVTERLKTLGNNARRLCEQEFSYAKMAESYELLYEFTRKRNAA
jgi:glycosyltransferase involved in cell wall biosynthesis